MEQSSTGNEWSNRRPGQNSPSEFSGTHREAESASTLHNRGKDPELWAIARRRASFKGHFAVYLIMSVFFWVLWYFTSGNEYDSGLPWPVWPMLGWGIGVFFHYMGAYVTPSASSVDREYEKLLREKERRQ